MACESWLRLVIVIDPGLWSWINSEHSLYIPISSEDNECVQLTEQQYCVNNEEAWASMTWTVIYTLPVA